MSADQWFGAAIIAGAIVTIVVFRRESRLRREASPVVPLASMLHEQDSAEAYDDTPEKLGPTVGDSAEVARDKFIRAGWVEVAPGYWANPKALFPLGLSQPQAAARARAAAHAHLDDFLADPEGYAGAQS